MNTRKLSAFIKESVKSEELIDDLPGLLAAAKETRELIWSTSDYDGDLKSLNRALLWFDDIDPDYGSIGDVAKILKANLTEIIEHPHSARVETRPAIAIAMWFAERTGDSALRRQASEANMVADLSFARDPDIHVYTE